jgi:hypothetical protein
VTPRDNHGGEHERFLELAATAAAGALPSDEIAELREHLRGCGECRDAWDQYRILASDGLPVLAAGYEQREPDVNWDVSAARRRLLARIGETEATPVLAAPAGPPCALNRPWRYAWLTDLRALVVACLLLAVGVAAGRLSSRPVVREARPPAGHAVDPVSAKVGAVAGAEAQSARLAQLEAANSAKRLEVEKLRGQFRALQVRLGEEQAAANAAEGQVAAVKNDFEQRLRVLSEQRDAVSAQLRQASQSWEDVQPELARLRTERDRATVGLSSLETRIGELTTLKQEQERMLKDAEQYLSADRDIRELMGARNLYIADVFDVDSNSRTRKPFGRVFYTREKSLIFYAFDLDRQPGLRNARAFQAWGRRETAQGERANSVNLGILYLDSESSRRWVLRVDDPQTLARIDAVFVTVEPHGGSSKPTGKPLLYATLRCEANHP